MAVSDRTTGTGESVAHWWGQAESVCWTLDRMAKAMELCNLYVIEWGCSWSNQCHINRWVWCRGISPSQQTLVSGHRWIVLLVGSVNCWLLLECVNGLLIGWMDVFLCTFIDIIVLEDVPNEDGLWYGLGMTKYYYDHFDMRNNKFNSYKKKVTWWIWSWWRDQ